MLAIANVNDINILSYFFEKNRSIGEICLKTQLLKSILLIHFLPAIKNSSLEIEKTCNKLKLLIKNGAELNLNRIRESLITKYFRGYFNNFETVLSFFLNRAFSNMICENKIIFSREDLEINVVPIAKLCSTIRPVVHFLLNNKAKTIKENGPNAVEYPTNFELLEDFFLTTIFVDACRHESVVYRFLQAGKFDQSSVLFNFNNDVLNLIMKIFLELGVSSSVLASKFSKMEFADKLLEDKKKAHNVGFIALEKLY